MGVMNFVYGMSNMMGALADKFQATIDSNPDEYGGYQALVPILELIDSALVPILIVLLSVATIYAVILGVNMARADSGEKREEAKKRLINFLIGAIIIIVLIAIIYALASNLDAILGIANNSLNNN
ncbi:MAG: hypothetical protein IJZ29_02920 [Clostridia bacterium]|nr:hypothetical protein [Clostridia bacterium]